MITERKLMKILCIELPNLEDKLYDTPNYEKNTIDR